MSTGYLIPSSAPATLVAQSQPKRRRQITPQAGRALEILGHAIEYLADEWVHEGGPLSAGNDRVMAVQLLMGLNRQVYFECPEALTLGERFRQILHFREA
jgi:hypothetical protein